MSLTTGARLGPYEVIGALGAGGMGEVYRARDSKLNRDVALKVLPDSFTLDGDRSARFRREAQVLAALNHPNIGAIYGLEDSGPTSALVLELVEGPTLADRIAQGPLPVDETIAIARQIADALESAHEQGVIHRDLKPANIKLRPDGTVKVLDFGLAKALTSESAIVTSGASISPTLTTPAMTGMGMILGTAAYMAPEQAKGRPIDKRSDVWAFGCVLFEMLTGTRAFDGDDIAEALASVIKTEPDWKRLPAETPRTVERLVRQCLRKDPKLRIPDISVARFALAEVLAGGSDERDAPPATLTPAPTRLGTRGLLLVAASSIVALVAGAAATWAWLRPVPAPLTQVRLQRPDGAPIGTPASSADVDISPDGRKVVYVTGAIGASQLFVQALDQTEPQSFPNIGNPVGPVFSTDGRWIAYFDTSTGTIRKVPSAGGSPVTITSSSGQWRGMHWGGDDTIVFATVDAKSGLMRVPAAGGTPEVLTTPDISKGEFDHWFPHQLVQPSTIMAVPVDVAAPDALAGQPPLPL